MDYGFVRGKKYSLAELDQHPSRKEKLNSLPLKPCRNRCNCYLLIKDVCTRHSWVFTFADKKPPISTVNSFLRKYGKPNGAVRTDKGGELANIIDCRKMIKNNHYVLQTKAPELSFQTCIVERLHQILPGMMRFMLLCSNLGSDYWLDAMLH